MPKINYIEPNGKTYSVDVKSGKSVMDGALKNGVPGIVAECGGSCSCATCHVHVDAAWMDRTGKPSPMEALTLESAQGVDETSRLSCQIKITDALDGLVVRVADSQY